MAPASHSINLPLFWKIQTKIQFLIHVIVLPPHEINISIKVKY